MEVLPSAIWTARAPSGQSAEFVRRVGDLADCVEQHFGTQPPQLTFGEIAGLFLVGRIGFRAPLVGVGHADVADDAFEVVVVLAELRRQGAQQLRVDRRIADTHIVHLVDDPFAKEMRPRRCWPDSARRRGCRPMPAIRPSPHGRSLPWTSGVSPPRNLGAITRLPTGWRTSPLPLL